MSNMFQFHQLADFKQYNFIYGLPQKELLRTGFFLVFFSFLELAFQDYFFLIKMQSYKKYSPKIHAGQALRSKNGSLRNFREKFQNKISSLFPYWNQKPESTNSLLLKYYFTNCPILTQLVDKILPAFALCTI